MATFLQDEGENWWKSLAFVVNICSVQIKFMYF
jgi:hypothetical protein